MTRARILPDREVEEHLLAEYALVGGMDEVGRGSLAGPVSVGLAVVSRTTPAAFPPGLADSKQLTPRRREALVEPCRAWATDHAVGHASPAEIDSVGIIGALRLAGQRALAEVATRGHLPGAIILDGTVNWLREPAPLTAGMLTDEYPLTSGEEAAAALAAPPVYTQVKADAHCAVVAAASVLAKVERDALMAALPDPGYDWARNKGYASPAHVAGLARLGAGDFHRRSWHLPGLDRATGTVETVVADAPARPAARGRAHWA
ncbi:RNase HII [Actinomyces ruminicola]|uniref:Ribonuclease n=1 Tax=Actinomyces ruminicola TaxID=332524 RepID=A0A1G9ZD90_9ACTO|nr:ribonuclease HII [Actinomyces ruminicola]SDN19204.1 RNase HII [Actinomyces ruminicola]